MKELTTGIMKSGVNMEPHSGIVLRANDGLSLAIFMPGHLFLWK